MVRITDLDESLKFYCDALGLEELRRHESKEGRFTLIFLAAPGDETAQVELTHNWDPEPLSGGRNCGHLAYQVGNKASAVSGQTICLLAGLCLASSLASGLVRGKYVG